MADITNYLNNIKNAVIGKEVRQSIHDGIKVINDEVEIATQKQSNFTDDINKKIDLMKEGIKEISTSYKSINLLNIYDENFKIGKSMDGTTGEELTDSNYVLTGYCEINPNSHFLLSSISTTNSWGRTLKTHYNYAFYDKNKQYISGTNYFVPSVGTTPVLMDSPSNAVYIRMAFSYSTVPTLETIKANEVMLFETSPSTCATDERLPFEDYYNYQKISIENIDENLKSKFIYAENSISNLNSNIEDISQVIVSKNLFDVTKCEVGKIIDGTTNIITSNSKSVLSGYCEIESSKKYLITGYSSTNSWGRTLKYSISYAYYDKNKQYISGGNYFNFALTGTITLLSTPSNAKYIRFSVPYSVDLTQEYVVNSQLMLFKTTNETCAVDEKMAFVEYFNHRRVTIDNLSEDIKEMLFEQANQNETNELMRLKDKYRYIVPSFRGSIKNSLILLGTNDLKRFDLIAEQGIYTVSNPTSKCLRDPSIIQIEDYYYLMYTTCGFEQGDEVGFCRTKDFVNYEELSNIPVTNPEGTGDFYYVWAPAWFRDLDGSLYIISACSVDSTSFYTYISKYDETTHTIVSTHKTNVKSIDAHIYYENSKYYMFVGGAFIWKSDTLLGTWTGISGNNLQYTGYEADFAVRLEDGSWRLFMQELPQTHSSAHMVYVDAPSIEGTWSEPKRVEYTKKALDYIRSINGNDVNTEYYHWTIYDFNRVLGNNNYFKS